MEQTRYQEMVKQASPNSHTVVNCVKAFVVGGLICDLGQLITNIFVGMGASKEDAGMYNSIILIFLAILFTGFGLYAKLGKFAGGGSIVPITGFANSVASPAIEFKKEGFIIGMAAKMFIVAGPVIVYGTLTSIVVGIFYYFSK